MDPQVLGALPNNDLLVAHGGSPTPSSGHIVRFYEADQALIEGLSRFIGSALGAGHPAIVIATELHRDAQLAALQLRGIDPSLAVQQGRFISLDASESLARFMVAGEPNPVLFKRVIGKLIEEASAVAQRSGAELAVFGEMASVLWAQGNPLAAIVLEKLWNKLATIHRFQLHCAYPMNLFCEYQDAEKMAEICAQHSHIIPTERYTSGQTEDQRLRTIAFLQQKAQALELEVARSEKLRADGGA